MKNSPYSIVALKRSAVYFLTGKAISALLTLIIILWLVRLLALEEYGVYVVLLSGMELVLAITSFGLPWVAARYLPEFRLHANGKMLTHFVWGILAWGCLFLLVGVLVLLFSLPVLLPMEFLQYNDVVRFYLLVLLVEGLGRYVRENLLGPLLLQEQAQISLVMRNLALLLLLAILATQDIVHLHQLVLIELLASILGFIVAMRGLIRYLQVHYDLPGRVEWQPPNRLEMKKIAYHTYFSHLVALTYSPQAFVFLVQHHLGFEAVALFGFLRNLYEQIARILPAKLLFSLIQPKLVASFVGSGGMVELTRNANLIGKMGLFVLMPVLVFTWTVGDEFLNLFSGGKFNQTGYYLAGFFLALIPLSQRQILVTVVVVSGKSNLVLFGASLGMMVLPLAYWLLEAGQYGMWSPIIAIIMGQMIFNITLSTTLVCTTNYRPDVIGFFKLIAMAIAEFILIQQFVILVHDWFDLLIMAALVFVIFLLMAYFVKPFRKEELMKLKLLVNRK
ncbi:hypothetical protein [Nitrosomonas sp.]|uniref:hypothetical protein n=1 Tax=Nitrosomonas sp. TaxID=42353 RepID=UPI00273033DD|nr:hypothetical protein [Nitrosomonas sp.]MDP2225047.1 hypothetical protein [Nitrosomonas sp.]